MDNEQKQDVAKAKGVSVRVGVVLAVFMLLLLVFLLIMKELVLGNQTGFDQSVFQSLRPITSPAATSIFTFLTFFGSTKFLLPAYILIALFFIFFKRNTVRSFNVIAIGLSSVGLLFLMKNIFQRQRPPDPLIAHVSGFSFPSGHSFSTFTFCGIFIYLLWESAVNRAIKWLGTIALVVFAASVATSRVYLHVHYASDVIAGFCLSFLWLTICIYLLSKMTKRGKVKTTTD